MAYIGKSPGTGVRNRFIYTATAAQTTFSGSDDHSRTLSYTDAEFTDVFLNGVKLDKSDYTATSGTSIVLGSGATAGDNLEVLAFDTFSVFSGEFSQDVTIGADLTVDTDTLVVDSTNNRVGIGTTSPYRTLTVSGDQTTEGLLEITSATPQLLFSVPSGGLDSRIHNDGSGNFIFGTGTNSATPTERMRILSGGGITFNGDTAVANALDDYEEGTYYPTLTADSGSFTINSSYQRLAYTKIGDMVHLQGQIVTSAASSPTGVLRLSLPFTSAASVDIAGRSTTGSLMFMSGTGAPAGGTYYTAAMFIAASSSSMQLWAKDIDGAWDTSVADWLGVGDIYISISYKAA